MSDLIVGSPFCSYEKPEVRLHASAAVLASQLGAKRARPLRELESLRRPATVICITWLLAIRVEDMSR
jgi:hypothetical protein